VDYRRKANDEGCRKPVALCQSANILHFSDSAAACDTLLGYMALITLFIAGIQMLVEGSRWQMFPAYTLAGLFCLAWLLQNFAPTNGLIGQLLTNRFASGLSVGLGVPALVVAIILPIIGEELGWSGYPIDPLKDRWGAFRASLVLGSVWVVWLYNNTGKSVFATALFHTAIKVTWQLFPVNGSYFDPRVTGLILALVVVVIVVWEPRTLARYRYAA